MKPKITPYQLDEYSSQTSELYSAIEQELFLAIAKRLKAPPTHGKDHVLQWQIERMNELRMYNRETIKILAKYTGLAEDEIDKAIARVGFDSAKDIDTLLSEAANKPIPPKGSIDTLMAGLAQNAKSDINNMVNAYLITTSLGIGEAQRQYVSILNESVAQVLASNLTINQAVTRSVIKAKAKGMNTAFVDKGGRRWKMEHYAETVVRSTVNTTYRDVSMMRMEEFDIDLIRVSSHINARPICAQIQGRIASIKRESIGRYPSIYDFGYGTPGGIGGVNCKHMFYPYVDGVNTNNEIQFDEKAVEKAYRESQQQRKLERNVREAKQALQLAEATGDVQEIEKQKQRVKDRQDKSRKFSNEKGLTRRYDRERITKQ